jgi:hypothetical protein
MKTAHHVLFALVVLASCSSRSDPHEPLDGGVGSCPQGFANCNVTLVDGCETNVAIDPMNCGGCKVRCPSPQGVIATCVVGKCSAACIEGRADCNGAGADGCEVDSMTDPKNCGGCRVVCDDVANGVGSCRDGECVLDCNRHYADCDLDPATGCEVNLESDTMHCGACEVVCSDIHRTPGCAGGVCGGSCETGWADCDGDDGNGCETSLAAGGCK